MISIKDLGMVGNRLKLIRQANGLSLQDLSNMLAGSRLEIGRAALSHYETGNTVPSAEALDILAKKLGTTVSFFHSPDWENVSFRLFSPCGGWTQKAETAMLSFVQIELEKMLYIDGLLSIRDEFQLPQKKHIGKDEDESVEELSIGLRQKYGLGIMPISSVSNTLESMGWKTIEMSADSPFVSGYEESSRTAFILYPALFVIDDFRTSLLETAGYAYIGGESASHTMDLVRRFARAMLFPAAMVKKEFGSSRSTVSLSELALAKQKYGISKRSVMKRLLELDIITQDYYDSFEDLMKLHGFPKRKQILSESLMFYENPSTLTMRVLSAQNQGLISKEKVDSLLLIKQG